MSNERGLAPIAVLLGLAVLIAAVFWVCDAMIDDESEREDVGAPALIHGDDDDHCRNQCGNEHPDCYQASAACSDDDFSPSFDKSPVEDSFNPTICLPYAHCGPEEEAAS